MRVKSSNLQDSVSLTPQTRALRGCGRNDAGAGASRLRALCPDANVVARVPEGALLKVTELPSGGVSEENYN